jgi:hypothetical protein
MMRLKSYVRHLSMLAAVFLLVSCGAVVKNGSPTQRASSRPGDGQNSAEFNKAIASGEFHPPDQLGPVAFIPGVGIARMATPLVGSAEKGYPVQQSQKLALVTPDEKGKVFFELPTDRTYREIRGQSSSGDRLAFLFLECPNQAQWSESYVACAYQTSVYVGSTKGGPLSRVMSIPDAEGAAVAVGLTGTSARIAVSKRNEKVADPIGLAGTSLTVQEWDVDKSSKIGDSKPLTTQESQGLPCSTADGSVWSLTTAGNNRSMMVVSRPGATDWSKASESVSAQSKMACGKTRVAVVDPESKAVLTASPSDKSPQFLTILPSKVDISQWSTVDVDPFDDTIYVVSDPPSAQPGTLNKIDATGKVSQEKSSEGPAVGHRFDGRAWTFDSSSELSIREAGR